MRPNEAMGEPRKRLTRMRYHLGPMGFLADQIMKEMQRAGYPPREFNLYRAAHEQERLKAARVSNAGPFESAHQYYAATDIIHERWAWFADDEAPEGKPFWRCLWDCVEVVGEKYDVEFSPQLGWDLAHVQLANWREFKEVVGEAEPSPTALQWYFHRTLPRVWSEYQKRKA